jgi:hypothetical protein
MHRHWRYPNLTLLFLSLLLSAFLLVNGTLQAAVSYLGVTGYVGVFFAGMLFVSTFTLAPAAAVLYAFAQFLDPPLVALVAATGAALGDYLAYRFIRERLFAELNPFLKALHLYRRVNILHSKYFVWWAPVMGAIFIASPLPDELGLTLLGMKKITAARFITLTFTLHFIGIYLLTLAARAAAS